MYRRIHFSKAAPIKHIRDCLIKHPKLVFIAMILSMVVSAGLAFTVMRQKNLKAVPIRPPLSKGFGSVLQAGDALQEVLQLQSQINSILQKKTLTSLDTLVLRKSFKRLDLLNSKLSNQQ